MPEFRPAEETLALLKNGFVLERTKGGHQIYFNHRTRRRVTVPIHGKDLPRGTLLEILKQAGISRDKIR